jgi:hypothetical protein
MSLVTGKSTLTAQYVEGRTIDFYDPTIENSESYQYCAIPVQELSVTHFSLSSHEKDQNQGSGVLFETG